MTLRCSRAAVLAAALFFAAGIQSAAALSLEEAYLAAIQYDADLLAADSARLDVKEGVGVARAALLPQLGYSMQNNRSDTYTNYVNNSRYYKDYSTGEYRSKASSLTLRQPLFRKPAWDALQVAKGQASAAEADYLKETQNSGLRAISSYLDVLARRATASLAHKQVQAMDAWLDMAKRIFQAGQGTKTDIADARSRRDIARATETEANLNLEAAARNFEVVTGLPVEQIPDLNPRNLDSGVMLLDRQDEWLQRIAENSPDIQSLQRQLEAAEALVDQMRGGHLPTVDLVAGKGKSFNETNTSLSNPAEYTTSYVGLQMNMPLLNGGGVLAQTDQALARREKVRQSLESVRRKTMAEAKRLFFTIQQGDQLVKAQAQAVLSAEQAVEGQKRGILAGTRTFVDVLDAERRLYEALRDHAVAVYTLVNNRFRFLALAGEINADSVKTVSAWLAASRQ